MSINFSSSSNKVIDIAKGLANEQSTHVELYHLLLAIEEEGSSKIASILRSNLNKIFLSSIGPQTFIQYKGQLSKFSKLCITQAKEIGSNFKLDEVEPECIFLAIVHILKSNSYTDFIEQAFTSSQSLDSIEKEIITLLEQGLLVSAKGGSSVPSSLEDFCIDLTNKARNHELDPLIGREEELQQIVKTLLRKTKSNVLILGEPGSGKTQLVEGLAQLIVSDSSTALSDVRILSLDTGALISGTKFRGELEERIAILLDYCKKNPNNIIFIDEIHTIVGLGNYEGSLDLSNLLKPPLSRGQFKCIGATTRKEFKQNIERDKALTRRFNVINLDECSVEDTFNILKGIRSKYERYHGMQVPDSILKVIVQASREITNRTFPDKAIDVLDEAGSRLKIRSKLKGWKEYNEALLEEDYTKAKQLKINLPILEESLVYEVVESITTVPINKDKSQTYSRFKSIETTLKQRVIAQEPIINQIASCIKRSFLYSNLNKPKGSFLLCGNTGVGKSYIVKELAKLLLTHEAQFIQIDMSEYQESHSISKLIGSPPGYIGYEDNNFIFSRVKNYPFCIVLFDEIEKAHKSVYNLLLQILDEGFVTDSVGRKIHFNNCFIFMTSNIGSSYSDNSSLGFEINSLQTKEAILANKKSSLKEFFSPEFLNRLDEILFANSLNLINLASILTLRLEEVKQEVKYPLVIDPSVITFLMNTKINLNFGGREINRIVTSFKDSIVDYILKQTDISSIYITIKEDKLDLSHS